MRFLYRQAPLHLEFERGEEHISPSQLISGSSMRLLSIHSEPDTVWRRARRSLQYVRDWPANGNSPYSPLFCVSLLLAVGLIIEIGH